MNVFDLVARLTLNSDEYDKGLDDAKGKASGWGSALGAAAKVGAAALATATTAVVAFTGESVKVGAGFDQSMSQVAATMGVTVDSIQNLREFAQEMGSTTAFSASQAADALNYMALAGYDAETSMSMLPNVLNLAAAGGIELAAASDMVTDAQSALGISLDETAELVDKMAKASSKSNTSVAQLGDAILTVGGTAKNLAGGTTELSTALGILADNGIKGAEGGTALRNVILALSAPTDTAAKKMAELGLETYDAAGNLRPIEDIFLDLNDTLSTMTQGEQAEVLNTLFNKVDLKSANALLATSAKRWDELSSAIDDASGAAAQMADTQLDNLNGDITLFQSALEGAQIAISEGLMPNLREFVQFGSSGISRLTEAFKEGGLSGAMNAFGDVLSDALALVLSELPKFISAGASLLSSLVQGIIKNLPLLVKAAGEVIVTLAKGIAESLPELIPTIVDVVLTMTETILDNLDMFIDASVEIIIALAEGIINALPRLLEKAPIIVEKLVTAIINNVSKLLTAAVQIILKLAEGLVQNFPTIVQKGIELVGKIVEGIVQAFGSLVSTGANIIAQVGSGIESAISGAAQWGRDMISNFISGITAGWESLKSKVTNVASAIASPFKHSVPKTGPFKDELTWMPHMMQNLAQGIEDNAWRVNDALDDVTGGMRARISAPDLSMESAAYGGSSASVGSENLVEALREALSGMGVYMDGYRVGELISISQSNTAMAWGV